MKIGSFGSGIRRSCYTQIKAGTVMLDMGEMSAGRYGPGDLFQCFYNTMVEGGDF